MGRKTLMMFDARQTEKTGAPMSAQQYAAPEHRVRSRKDGSAVQADGMDTDWAALMLRVRDHQDKVAFAALFRHFAPRVKAFLMKSGADATLAEECAQDVMATLWQKANLFDPTRASVATWVFTIARNRRIDALRKARRPNRKSWTGDRSLNPIRPMSSKASRKRNGWVPRSPSCPTNSAP